MPQRLFAPSHAPWICEFPLWIAGASVGPVLVFHVLLRQVLHPAPGCQYEIIYLSKYATFVFYIVLF
jgi:hypothetical protein